MASTNKRPPSLCIGRFRIEVTYREVTDDKGFAIHVYGPAFGQEEEVMRFDCFERCPHYHLAWSYRNEPFVKIEAEDAFAWSLDLLRSETNALLGCASADAMTSAELEAFTHALEEIDQWRLRALP